MLVFSGSTGAHVFDPDPRPEFPQKVRAYHTVTDTWVDAGPMPRGLVTTNVVLRDGRLVLASGEVRPGVRTPKVFVAEVAPRGHGFGAVDAAVLALYLIGLVAIGLRFQKRSESTDDFFLAGRRIPWWAAGISIFATQLSAITFVATPAVAYATDWLVLPGKAMILAMAPVVVLLYLPFFRRLDVTTAYEYLERRFSLSVRLFGSASFVAFQLLRMAIVIFLPALALASITGIDVYVCVAVMGVLATLYTVLGGMEAVVWTDVLQTVVAIATSFAPCSPKPLRAPLKRRSFAWSRRCVPGRRKSTSYCSPRPRPRSVRPWPGPTARAAPMRRRLWYGSWRTTWLPKCPAAAFPCGLRTLLPWRRPKCSFFGACRRAFACA